MLIILIILIIIIIIKQLIEIIIISTLVRTLWLVNLAGRTLLHRLLKFKVFLLLLLPNCCMIYHQIFATCEANDSLKLSFTLNCVLMCANGT